jgi:hypothetical protein
VVIENNVKGEHGYAMKFNTADMTPDNGYLYIKTKAATIVQFFSINVDGIVIEGAQKLDNALAKKGLATL